MQSAEPETAFFAFDSRAEGTSQIYVVPADGGAQRRVTSGDADSAIPSWSRDGRWIYFESDRSGQWRVWKVPASGGDAVQVTYSQGGAAFESADGKSLYFFSGETKGLFRVPVGGGVEKQVAPVVFGWIGFSVTAKGVYFLSDSKTLQLLDETTGLIRTVARLGGHSVGTAGITGSSDSAYLMFTEVKDNERWDLMLVEGFRRSGWSGIRRGWSPPQESTRPRFATWPVQPVHAGIGSSRDGAATIAPPEGNPQGDSRAPARRGSDAHFPTQRLGPGLHIQKAMTGAGFARGQSLAVVADAQRQPVAGTAKVDFHVRTLRVAHDVVDRLLE